MASSTLTLDINRVVVSRFESAKHVLSAVYEMPNMTEWTEHFIYCHSIANKNMAATEIATIQLGLHVASMFQRVQDENSPINHNLHVGKLYMKSLYIRRRFFGSKFQHKS
jgi:hypothetical protein